MNPKARVSAVKSDRTVREWEEVLRDAADLSRSEAKVAASAVAKALEQRDAGTQEMPLEVVSEVEKLTKILKS
jgi:mannitol/fructose-specific phosphotransferase system IIA component (Ntr-type)